MKSVHSYLYGFLLLLSLLQTAQSCVDPTGVSCLWYFWFILFWTGIGIFVIVVCLVNKCQQKLNKIDDIFLTDEKKVKQKTVIQQIICPDEKDKFNNKDNASTSTSETGSRSSTPETVSRSSTPAHQTKNDLGTGVSEKATDDRKWTLPVSYYQSHEVNELNPDLENISQSVTQQNFVRTSYHEGTLKYNSSHLNYSSAHFHQEVKPDNPPGQLYVQSLVREETRFDSSDSTDVKHKDSAKYKDAEISSCDKNIESRFVAKVLALESRDFSDRGVINETPFLTNYRDLSPDVANNESDKRNERNVVFSKENYEITIPGEIEELEMTSNTSATGNDESVSR